MRAQAAFAASYLQGIAEHGYSDDDIDYLPGILELTIALQADHYNSLSLGTNAPAALNRDTTAPVSAEVAVSTRTVIETHGAYPGDYGPQEVFTFLGLPQGAVEER